MPNFTQSVQAWEGPPKTVNFTKFWNMDTPLGHIRCAILTIVDPFVLFVFVHHAFERWRLWTRYIAIQQSEFRSGFDVIDMGTFVVVHSGFSIVSQSL